MRAAGAILLVRCLAAILLVPEPLGRPVFNLNPLSWDEGGLIVMRWAFRVGCFGCRLGDRIVGRFGVDVV